MGKIRFPIRNQHGELYSAGTEVLCTGGKRLVRGCFRRVGLLFRREEPGGVHKIPAGGSYT